MLLSRPAPVGVSLNTEVLGLAVAAIPLFGVTRIASLVRGMREEPQARRTAEARTRHLMEHVSDWVWEVDARPCFTYCGPQCRELLGYTPEELLGKSPHSLLAPEELEHAKVEFDRLMEARRPFVRVENVNVRKDGSRVVLETSGTPILNEDGSLLGYLGIDRDVTERKDAERSLARMTRALRVLGRATEFIIRAREESELLEEVCKVVVVEGSYRMAWIGYAGSRADGWRVLPVAHWGAGADYVDSVNVTWDDSETGRGPSGQAIRTRQPVAVHDTRTDPSFEPWRDEAQAHGYGACVALPLTFRNRCYGSLNVYAEDADAFQVEEIELLGRLAADVAFGIRALRLRKERQELEELVRHKQRMESLGELTAGLAHDINNILTVILANVGLLEENGKISDSDSRRSMHDIKAATENGAAMVRKLLAFSHKEEPELALLDLAAKAEEECRLLRRVLPATVTIEPVIGEGDLPVLADPRALDQIFMNLAFNARDAMPEGGTLRVQVGRRDVDVGAQGFHGPVIPGQYACIQVDDTGTGMDAGTQARLFEPFFTTRTRSRGTGLGLAVVYGLVESHNGFLEVESTPGEGTSMRVFLPLATKEPEAGVAGEDEQARSANVILIADDDAHVRDAAVRILGRYGYDVVSAGDGREALSLLQDRSSAFALLISDLAMPGMGGGEVVRALRDADCHLPVILTSGRPTPELEEAASLGGVSVLEKPWTVEELLGAVRSALGPPE